jgi:hypothetical protein
MVQLYRRREDSLYPASKLYSFNNDRNLRELDAQSLDRAIQQGYHPRIVLVDTGLITELTDINRRNFLDLFSAIVHGDGQTVAHLMVDRARLSPSAWFSRFYQRWKGHQNENAMDVPWKVKRERCRDYAGFEAKMGLLLNQIHRDTFRLANVQIGSILTEVYKINYIKHISIISLHNLLIKLEMGTHIVLSDIFTFV